MNEADVFSVKEDQRLVVNQLQALESALALAQGPDASPEQQSAVLAQLRTYFLHDLLAHLNQEEEVFFPAVERLPDGPAKVARLYREHEELRGWISEFRSGMVLAEHVGLDARNGWLWRLINDARIILERLKSHAAFESELVRELNGIPATPRQEVAHVP